MKTGAFIRSARQNKGIPQEKPGTIPPELSQILDVSIDELVTGEMKEVKADPVPMKNLIEASVKEKKEKTNRILILLPYSSLFSSF